MRRSLRTERLAAHWALGGPVQPEFRAEIYEIPHDSPVRVKIRAAAIPGKGNTFPRLSFELGSFRGNGVSDQKEGGNIEVRSQELRTYEFIVHGANFPFQSNKPSRPSYFRIFNDFRRGTSDLALRTCPNSSSIGWRSRATIFRNGRRHRTGRSSSTHLIAIMRRHTCGTFCGIS